MDSGAGFNAPFVAVGVVASLWAGVTAFAQPIVTGLLIALIGKLLDLFFRRVVAPWVADKLYWRREALKLKERAEAAERGGQAD